MGVSMCGGVMVTRDYLSQANDHIAAVAMVETRDAINNLDKILGVEGLDGVFIGELVYRATRE